MNKFILCLLLGIMTYSAQAQKSTSQESTSLYFIHPTYLYIHNKTSKEFQFRLYHKERLDIDQKNIPPHTKTWISFTPDYKSSSFSNSDPYALFELFTNSCALRADVGGQV